MAATLTLSNVALCDERVIYEAIYRNVIYLALLDWHSADTKLAAELAVQVFPQVGYPVPHWIAELAA